MTGSAGAAYDLKRIAAYRLATLSNRLTLWAARTYGREFGVTVLEWRVVAALGALGDATAREVSDFTVLDKSNVSRAVDRLAARGLVGRARHPRDRRSKLLSLTPAGRALRDAVAARSLERERLLLRGLSASERGAFSALLDKLERGAADLLDGTGR